MQQCFVVNYNCPKPSILVRSCFTECPGGLLDIALVLDSSGSMLTSAVNHTDRLYPWTLMQNASLSLARAFLPLNSSNVQISVTSFADNPRHEMPLGRPGNERSQTAFMTSLDELTYKYVRCVTTVHMTAYFY